MFWRKRGHGVRSFLAFALLRVSPSPALRFPFSNICHAHSRTATQTTADHLNSPKTTLPASPTSANMQILSTWVLLASAALGALAAEDLKIDLTVPVECDRKTQSGDKVQMHYRGTLAADGKQFDASMSDAPRPHASPYSLLCPSSPSSPPSHRLTREAAADQCVPGRL